MTTKILFVDDEPNVLSGLRRLLREKRRVWTMRFANGGEEALQILENESFDVIVSDMRMPGIDGAELLTRVARDYPQTVRLVLSGQSDHEKIFRAVGPAHQFLTKPCDSKVLVETIERACGLRNHLQEQSLVDVTSRLQNLPSLPSVYAELFDVLESDDASITRVGKKIGSDVAMSAKVLQLVNSSFFGLPHHVASPEHAVSMLGLNVIRPLVLTAKVFSRYQDPEIEGFSLDELTEHSLAVATTARRIAELEKQPAHIADDACIAGMLHDIGKLVFAANLPDRYATVVQTAAETNRPLEEAEREAFGTSHAELGAHLLGLWGLPNPITEAVAFHHHPAEVPSSTFSPLTAVHVADAILKHPGEVEGEEPNWDLGHINAIGAGDRRSIWQSAEFSQEVVS